MIVGVDEAGRGPIAGPVIAAAVILNPHHPIVGLKDSKKLSVPSRAFLFAEICDKALAYGVGRAEVYEIEKLNILQATLLAMQRAVLQLAVVDVIESMMPIEVYIDGQHCPVLPKHYKTRALVRGDDLMPAISAASILAKVTRDREMLALDAQYPGYGFAVHKGYPTARHLEQLRRLGPCEIHRKTFGPVAELLLMPP